MNRKGEHVLSIFELIVFCLLAGIGIIMLMFASQSNESKAEDKLTVLRSEYLAQEALNNLLETQTPEGKLSFVVGEYFSYYVVDDLSEEDISRREALEDIIRSYTLVFIEVMQPDEIAAIEGISFELYRNTNPQEKLIIGEGSPGINQILTVFSLFEDTPREVQVILPVPENTNYYVRAEVLP